MCEFTLLSYQHVVYNKKGAVVFTLAQVDRIFTVYDQKFGLRISFLPCSFDKMRNAVSKNNLSTGQILGTNP